MVVHEGPQTRHSRALAPEYALELVDDIEQDLARRVDLEGAVHVEEQERVARRQERQRRFELRDTREVSVKPLDNTRR